MTETAIRKSIYANVEEFAVAQPEAYNAAVSQNFIKELCKTFGWEKPKRNINHSNDTPQDSLVWCKQFIEHHLKTNNASIPSWLNNINVENLDFEIKNLESLYTKDRISQFKAALRFFYKDFEGGEYVKIWINENSIEMTYNKSIDGSLQLRYDWIERIIGDSENSGELIAYYEIDTVTKEIHKKHWYLILLVTCLKN